MSDRDHDLVITLGRATEGAGMAVKNYWRKHECIANLEYAEANIKHALKYLRGERSMSDLRDELAAVLSKVDLVAHTAIMSDGYPSSIGHTNAETATIAVDTILARYAVVELPPVHPEEFTRPMHAKVPGGDDPKWAEVSLRTDGRIQLAGINNPFRSDAEARDTAAAILAILAAKDAK